MIKISYDAAAEPLLFTKETIIIGDGSSGPVDISFPTEGLHQNHIKIVLKDGDYWVINHANDPFVILNENPFWKKKLKVGDILQIRSHTLRIEQLLREEILKDEPIPVAIPEDSLKVSPLVEEAYNLESHQQQRVPAPTPPVKKTPPQRSKKWIKTTLLLALTLIAIFSWGFAEVYFQIKDKVDREEILAAESLADHAMALQYAKVYHIAPQKQSWIDPQFLKNNLVDLLSTTSLPCGNIDAQGQFSNCPYILRFYTNRDFSRFLLIAQPDATFSEWVVKRKTLILDSSLMVLHKTDDLKTLNRLLSYPTPLDGASGEEIRRTIEKTEIIPLALLSKKTGKSEFSPPIGLAYIKPGAENLIYNAPRYYQFGETFLKKAIFLSEEKSPIYEMSILQSELDTLAKFQNLIFYSSHGIKEAFKGHQALHKLVIPMNFFTAYLVFSKQGKIINSRLIVDSELSHLQAPPVEPLIAYEPIKILETDETQFTHLLQEQIKNAQEEIGPILQDVYTILQETIKSESLYLPPALVDLIDLYQVKRLKISQSLSETVNTFIKDHPQISEETIHHLLREYGLLDFYPPDLTLENWEAFQQIKQLFQNKAQDPYLILLDLSFSIF